MSIGAAQSAIFPSAFLSDVVAVGCSLVYSYKVYKVLAAPKHDLESANGLLRAFLVHAILSPLVGVWLVSEIRAVFSLGLVILPAALKTHLLLTVSDIVSSAITFVESIAFFTGRKALCGVGTALAASAHAVGRWDALGYERLPLDELERVESHLRAVSAAIFTARKRRAKAAFARQQHELAVGHRSSLLAPLSRDRSAQSKLSSNAGRQPSCGVQETIRSNRQQSPRVVSSVSRQPPSSAARNWQTEGSEGTPATNGKIGPAIAKRASMGAQSAPAKPTARLNCLPSSSEDRDTIEADASASLRAVQRPPRSAVAARRTLCDIFENPGVGTSTTLNHSLLGGGRGTDEAGGNGSETGHSERPTKSSQLSPSHSAPNHDLPLRKTRAASDQTLRVGARVLVRRSGYVEAALGTCLFHGTTEFFGGRWVGVELDEAQGKNDGSVNGIAYFTCRAGHGIFCQESAVTVLQSD
jgi:hypothetical protein